MRSLLQFLDPTTFHPYEIPPAWCCFNPQSLARQSSDCITVFTTSSQILISRGVAGLDTESPTSPPTVELSVIPLVTVIENHSIHPLLIPKSPAIKTFQSIPNVKLHSHRDGAPLYLPQSMFRRRSTPKRSHLPATTGHCFGCSAGI